jgi:hypothetical protein
LGLVAKDAGFTIREIKYDSTEFQFWGSEQISAEIALNDNKSFKHGFDVSMFTPIEIENFRTKATILNNDKAGDQACFFLRRLS